jgi:hypothetical protein
MVRIEKEVKRVIDHIKKAEALSAHKQNESAPEVSVAT